MNGWIGVDLDGTLAVYDKWNGVEHIGEPIPVMVKRVREWLKDGKDVRIVTARVFAPTGDMQRQREAAIAVIVIQNWCADHLGKMLPVTCMKDFAMIELWDDRCVQVIPNTGVRADQAVPATA